jgi:hypothetical protein
MTICHDVEPQLSQMVTVCPTQPLRPRSALTSNTARRAAALQDLERLRVHVARAGPVALPDHSGSSGWSPARRRTKTGGRAAPRCRHRAVRSCSGSVPRPRSRSSRSVALPPCGRPCPLRRPCSNAAAPGTVEAVAEELKLATVITKGSQLEALAKSGGTLIRRSPGRCNRTFRRSMRRLPKAGRRDAGTGQ